MLIITNKKNENDDDTDAEFWDEYVNEEPELFGEKKKNDEEED